MAPFASDNDDIAAPGGFRPLALSSMFWKPDYLKPGVSAWEGHIPFAFWIMEALAPQTFVELGTHYGTSYFAFCQAVERLGNATTCYAVDTWEGDDQAGFYGEEVFATVNAYHAEHYAAFSTLIRSTFDQAQSHFEDGSIDLLHIDGHHTFDSVRHDFETWLPKLSDRAVVLFHDTNVRVGSFGVAKYFHSLKAQYPSFEFNHCHGLGVLAVGPKQPELIQQLYRLSAGPVANPAIHQIFSRLGQTCQDISAAKQAREQVVALNDKLAQQKQELELLKNKESWQRREWATTLAGIEGEKKRLKRELETTRQAAEQREIQHSRELAMADAAKQRWQESTQETATLQRELAVSRTQGAKLQQENQQLAQNLAASQQNQSQSAGLNAAADAAAEAAIQRLDYSEAQTARFKKELAEVRGQLTTVQQQHDQLSHQLVQSRQKLSQTAEMSAVAETQAKSSRLQWQESNQRVQAVQQESTRTRQQFEKLQNHHQQLALELAKAHDEAAYFALQQEETAREIAGQRQQLAESDEKNRVLQQQNDQLALEKQQAEATHRELEANIQERFNELSILAKLMIERDQTIESIQAELENEKSACAELSQQSEAQRAEKQNLESTLGELSRENDSQRQQLAKSDEKYRILQQQHDQLTLEKQQSETTHRELENNIQERFRELAAMANLIIERDQTIEATQAEIKQSTLAKSCLQQENDILHNEGTHQQTLVHELTQQNDTLSELIRQRDEQCSHLKNNVEQRFRELAELSEMYLASEERGEVALADNIKIKKSISWKITAPLRFPNQLLKKLGKQERVLRNQRDFILKSGLFDEDFYLKSYPDVAASKIDPICHYLLFGARELRNPNPSFNTGRYLDRYPDVRNDKKNINPLIHYVLYGMHENRR
jgi:hypothetical protein